MDELVVVLLLIVGVIAVAALVKAANMSDRLRRIDERFALLEQRLASGAVAARAARTPSPIPGAVP